MRVPAIVADVAMAGGTAALVSAAIASGVEPGSRPSDVYAYGLALLMGGLLLVRRRWPLSVLVATTVALLVYYSVGYVGIAPVLPLAGALYSAAEAGRVRWTIPVIAFFVAADVYVPMVNRHEPPLPLLTFVAERALALVALVLLGDTVRNRRLRLVRETARRLAEERLRIARDVHDTVGQSISAITVQAALADDVMDRSPDRAHEALREIRTAGKHALTELRCVIDMIRNGEQRPIGGLLEAAEKAGLRVESAVPDGPLPVGAYRIVQESLTNVIRHARASTVSVEIRREPGHLLIDVTDDGRGGAAVPGNGIAGMTERAAALGGELTAGPAPGGGFLVRARLPVREGEP
ncbi:sensor histidine kinase [Nonomuraea sediminis]|uniref:sensor histidine kinase n=1 Tax=Nonomuraea sediminis TaxID=2835864 RepID=UPI001BDDC0F2|nr:sensor histidine kinase [Nonomuraea sediminis]